MANPVILTFWQPQFVLAAVWAALMVDHPQLSTHTEEALVEDDPLPSAHTGPQSEADGCVECTLFHSGLYFLTCLTF